MSGSTLAVVTNTGSHGSSSSSPWALLAVGLVFVVVAGTQAVNPRLMWSLNRWRYKNPDANEPSDAAFAVTRVVGALVALLGVALVIVAITKL